MRILIVGSDDLATPMRELGHSVFSCRGDSSSDLPLGGLDPDWKDLQSLIKKRGISLDAVLVCDNLGRRSLPTGLWGCPAVTVFYGVDAPLNGFWHAPYHRLFDLVFMDQPREAAKYSRRRGQVHWLPVGVDFDLYQGTSPERKKEGVCFVGVRDPKVRPKRSAILDQVARLAPLYEGGGRRGAWLDTRKAAELYRSYKVMLNENLFPGITTRPLEGMAAGACVLSEAAPGAMDVFFKDAEQITYYTPDSLIQRLKRCLQDEHYCSRVAQNGQEAVRQGHTLMHRAESIIGHIESIARLPLSERGRCRPGEALGFEGEALLMAGARWGADCPSRIPRAGGRLRAVMKNGANPSTAAAAGLAASLLGQWGTACAFFERGAKECNDINLLSLALAAWHESGPKRAREIMKGLDGDMSALFLGPGQAEFHLACAHLLAGWGQDMTPGFNRQRLPMVFWTALEHLLEAVRLAPGMTAAWEMAGDLLMQRRAPNQAYGCFAAALKGNPGHAALEQKAERAARQGYMT